MVTLKLVTTVPGLVTKLVYSLEPILAKHTGKVRPDGMILELFQLYCHKVRLGKILPKQGNINHPIFLSFRKRTGGKLTKNQELYLIQLLNGRTTKWFVPHVLNVTDYFSLQTMRILLDVAIRTRDSKHISHFLNPASRVFDLKVNLDLQERLRAAHPKFKKRILWLLFCAESRKRFRINKDGNMEGYGAKYSWSSTRFVNNVAMDDEDFRNYCRSIQLVNYNKFDILLDEYFKTSKVKLKKSISQFLPKELEKYPDTLHKQAEAYLRTEQLEYYFYSP